MLSRSRIRKRICCSAKKRPRLRACCVTQLPLGLVVQPADVDAAAAVLEESHVEAAQEHRLDGEEVIGGDARGLRV